MPLSSCQSQVEREPLSSPILTASAACSRTLPAIIAGSVRHVPCHTCAPLASTTEISVVFCDTSRPTNRSMGELLWLTGGAPGCDRIAAPQLPHVRQKTTFAPEPTCVGQGRRRRDAGSLEGRG